MGERPKPSRVVDVLGLYCPEPLFRARMVLDEMEKGEVLEVLADDPAAEEDFKAWCRRTGNELLGIERGEGGEFRIYIRKR